MMMPFRIRFFVAMWAGWLACCMAGLASAATLDVAADDELHRALASAQSGDIIRLQAGEYQGPLVIDTPLTLSGQPGATIQGTGEGSVITVAADDVVIEGLTITGSGTDLPGMNSGILVKRYAARAIVRNNHLHNNLFGVYLHGAVDARVQGNTIIGRRDLRLSEAGNG